MVRSGLLGQLGKRCVLPKNSEFVVVLVILLIFVLY